MVDITMCANEKCPRRHECYRATATPGMMQSWCAFPVHSYDTCTYFIQDQMPENDLRNKDND